MEKEFDTEADVYQDLIDDAFVDELQDEDNEYFQYTEVIPEEGDIHSEDCTLRSISLATKKTYKEVENDLVSLGEKMHTNFNDYKVIKRYLNTLGWEESDILLTPENKLYTVGQYCEVYKHREYFNKPFEQEIPEYKEVLLICYDSADEDENGDLIPGSTTHMTYVKDGKVYDDRDCYTYKLYSYWYNTKEV